MWQIIFLIIAISFKLSYPLAAGAGQGACEDLTPRHFVHMPQTSPAPVTLVVSTNLITTGQSVELSINANVGFFFGGFMVQARSSTEILPPLGEFHFDDSPLVRMMDCAPFPPTSVVTHTGPEPKQVIELDWTPPMGFSGVIRFQ